MTELVPVSTLIASGLTATATTATLASTNGVQAGDVLFIGSEQMLIQSIGTGGQVTVQRGYNGTTPAAHSLGAQVADADNPNFDPNSATDAGVYMRMYDRNNNPLTGEMLVNTYTIGNQTSPSIAMDASGDFVVVWASQGQDPDGSWGIYGQRFNSVGQKVGGEFRVNSNYTNDQVAPAVAMDDFGNFVVVWATDGQSYSYFNDIHAQRFDADGQMVGSEFRVNSQNIPGTSATPSSNDLDPSVALSDNGTFVVTWDAVTNQQNGVVLDTVVMARGFDANGNPLRFEHSTAPRSSRRSTLARQAWAAW